MISSYLFDYKYYWDIYEINQNKVLLLLLLLLLLLSHFFVALPVIDVGVLPDPIQLIWDSGKTHRQPVDVSLDD